MIIGTRAQVFHGTADATAGGLTKKDLFQDQYGVIKSTAARKAALARKNLEGPAAMTNIFKPAKKGFKLQPEKGTEAYDKKMKKMKNMMKKMKK